jgi:hypothetical protein
LPRYNAAASTPNGAAAGWGAVSADEQAAVARIAVGIIMNREGRAAAVKYLDNRIFNLKAGRDGEFTRWHHTSKM